ncbi:ribosome maturation factor RimP [Holospora undulata HU1]|uniref:Ribosome maturation factor RimP n=2 Tax=Holospora TaxID=44747 RepID=A0A061JG54_9PROT|nr:ribosome maturation factor RimP [Holospora undulata HU1]
MNNVRFSGKGGYIPFFYIMNRELIWNTLSSYLEDKEYSLVQVTLQSKKESDLCVMIEHKKTLTLSIEECVKLSAEIEPILRSKGLLTDQQILEVSSPGVERPLVTPDHYKRYIGTHILVGIQGGKGQKYEGVLQNVLGSGIVLALSQDDILSVEWSSIKFCKLVYKFENQKETEE